VDILPEVERDFLADVAKKLCKTHKYNKIGLGDWILDNVGKSNLPKRRDGIKVSSVGNEDACRVSCRSVLNFHSLSCLQVLIVRRIPRRGVLARAALQTH